MRTLQRTFLPASFAVAATVLMTAQSPEQRFEAVAIKPLGPRGGPAPFSGQLIHPGGRFRDPGTTLRVLIAMAYDFHDLGVKITGLPEWAEAAAYSIDATAGPDYPASLSPKQNEENVLAMIRSMLADRFKLRIHQEQRETKVLILRTRNGGASLRSAVPPVPPEKEGFLSMALGDRGGGFSGKKITMGQIASSLTLFLKQRVEDRTGLTGFYDFEEKWEAPRRVGDPLPAAGLGPDGIALLISAIDQDLGLVLKPETAPADFWVVDHVEPPGEN